MKRRLVLLLFVCLIVSFASYGYSEPYINNNFPPDEILKKAAHDLVSYNVGIDNIDIVGNYKSDEDRYVVYFNIYHIGKKEITPFNLMKLDTGVWIIGSQKSGEKILQK